MNDAIRPRDRVVVYRLGSLGDTVVVLPCLNAIARAFPDSERVMLTNIPVSAAAAPLEAILGGSGLVHRYMAYPLGTRSWKALLALRASLRALDAKTLVYLTPARGLAAAWRDWLFFRFCGFTRIIGVPRTRRLQVNQRGLDGFVERECQRLARSVEVLGPIDLDDPHGWDLHLTPVERRASDVLLGPVRHLPRIAINMGGKVQKNDWGEANWQKLIQRLARSNADHALLIVGAAEDGPRAAKAAASWPGKVVDLCGRVTPRVSAAAMAGARVFVGHDSGPLHLAACMGVMCVSMYGDNNEPRKWHPVGAHHRILHDMRGVQAIGVPAVEQAVQSRLDLARETADDSFRSGARGQR